MLHPCPPNPVLQPTRRTCLALGIGLLGAGTFPGQSVGQSAFDLRVVQGSDIDTLDPAVSRSVPSQIVFALVFNTLVRWKDATLAELEPDLAEAWSKSEDGLRWTFQLRRGVKFHDDTPFDAEATKFNLDRILDPALGSPNRSLFSSIVKVAATASHTVEIETREPSPILLEMLAETYVSMNSPAAVKKAGRAYSRRPVGTGPYVLSEWTPGQQAVVRRNVGYFGRPGQAASVTFRPVPEAGARVIELEAGNADVALNIAPEAAAQIKQNRATTLIEEPSAFQVFFELNTTKPPFDDPRVRLAVNYAVDRKAIIEQILGGYARMPEGIFPAGVQGRVKQAPYPYDPERAKKILAEVFPDGFRDKVVMWTSSGRYMKDSSVAEAVQSYLNAIGLATEFKVWEWATYQKTLYQNQQGGTGHGSNAASMWLLGTGVTNADWRLRRKFFSTDGSNLTGFRNKEVDDLLTAAAADMDYGSRMSRYGEVQSLAWNRMPNSLVLFDQEQLIGVRAGVSGLEVYGSELVRLDQITKR